MKKISLALLVYTAIIASCRKDGSDKTDTPGTGSIETMQVARSFTFNTDNTIQVKITTLDNSDLPVSGIRISLFTDFPEKGGTAIAGFITGANGMYAGNVKLPAATDSVIIHTDAVGFVSDTRVTISNNSIACTLGGKAPVEVRRPVAGAPEATGMGTIVLRPTGLPVIKALGSFNGQGVPSYLVTPGDVIDAAFITDINNALPENQPVPNYHPEYLSNNNQTNLQFIQESEVWVTFVHEGAGYKNVLCYYTYDVNDPPASASDIDTLRAIFPNVSYVNSGGGLVSGNKVKIGTFRPGTVVGWAIIANGYNGSAITTGAGIYFSNHALNPESTEDLRKHCIMLNDANRQKLLISFEDLNRQSGADNDFNDAIFYATANPIQGIVMTNIPLPDYRSRDTDGDGVSDIFDDYPQDASQAFDNYYPAQNSKGTLAFEDLWPSRGDYDFNDMVADYNFNYVTNAQNNVTQIKAAITFKAIGASYHNGFGIQLPVSSNKIASVTGTELRGNYIQTSQNGTESGQSKATIIVTDDAFNQLAWPGTGIGVNTTPGSAYVQPRTLNIVIKLASPVSVSELGLPPYNPFIFINKNRASEVHLPNNAPTDLANPGLLGTQSDDSRPAEGRYYVTNRNLPFAINIVSPFDYPVEKKVITDTHLKFFQWGQSAGTLLKDWYKPLAGYRNTNNIYTH